MQCSSVVQLCTTLCNPTDYSPPVLPVHQQFPEFTQTHVHWVSEAIQPSHPLSSPSSPAFNLSQHQGLFKWAHSLHQVAKVLSFFFNISASNEHSGLISLGRTGWISLQSKGLRSFLQHHSSKVSILWHSALFIVQLSHPYMTTGKTIALTRETFIGTVMSLLSNMLSRLVITFFPRSKSLLISWLKSPSAVILEPRKIKSAILSTVSPSIYLSIYLSIYQSIYHEVMGLDAMILVFLMLSFQPTFSLSSFIFIKSLFISFSLSAKRVVSSAYLRLLIFLPEIMIPDCASSSPAFLMMHSAYKLNKQGDNIQTWRTPFPIWNKSVHPCPVPTVASWPPYRFFKREVRWSGIPIFFSEFSTAYCDPQSQRLWHSQ